LGKLFIKLWLFLLATSFLSFQIQTHVFEWASAQIRQERQRTPFLELAGEMTALYLHDVPRAQWPQRMHAIDGKLSYPAKIIGLDDLSGIGISAASIRSIRGGEVAYHLDQDSAHSVAYLRINDSESVLAMTLPPYKPLLVFGTLSPRTFAWLTESALYGLAVLLWLSLFWRDLKRVTFAAESIGGGNFDAVIKLSRNSALLPLATSFNNMTARISTLLRSHKDLTSAVSHELRTPLARLRFALSLAAEATSVSRREELIHKMHHDVNELDQLTDELLVYSRLDREPPPSKLVLVANDNWLPRVIEDESAAALAAGVNIHIDVKALVDAVHCEPKFLSRAIANLIRNALRFAKSHVEVGIVENRDNYEITVEDDGPGIPAQAREGLFLPFARTDESRNRATGGTGLGLAIVKRIAERHNGTVTVETASCGGARFVIRWPSVSA
jgi:two-component system, OmpR family, sensor kinase ParS